MKKLFTVMALALTTGSLMALPISTVTFAMSGDRFYQDSELNTPAAAGWYVEVILSSTDGGYVPEAFGAYATMPGIENLSSSTSHETGKFADGTGTSAGRTSIEWTFSDTYYTEKYATLRFYNNADKLAATKYGVLSTWYQITATPSDALLRPETADQVVQWGSTGDKTYLKYDIPAVPEPTSMALVGLGSLAMFIRRKMRKDA